MTGLIIGGVEDTAGIGVPSVIETWIDELDGERNRGINVLKSRGMGHSNQVREFLIGSDGVQIRDVYAGDRGVLMGSARRSQEARDRAEATGQAVALASQRRRLAQRRTALEAQIASLRAQLEAETLELSSEIDAAERRELQVEHDRTTLADARRDCGDASRNAGDQVTR